MRMRLRAETAEDLAVLSAAAQDALFRIGDAQFDAKARRFSAPIQRFAWEEARERGPYERVLAALSFESVVAVRTRRLNRARPDAFAQILALSFQEDPMPPGGEVRIVLAGDGEIALDVECLDAILVDLGAPWRTRVRPDHDADGD